MNIPFHKPEIGQKEIDAVTDSLRNGWLTMGKKTIAFETKFSSLMNNSYCVAVNSATAALHIALKLIDLKPEDEVIVPAITFAATAEVVRYFDAKPIIVDVNKDDMLINIESIEKNITKKTKAIIPVHYAGQPCDMDRIKNISDKYNLYIIEDAAHSLPSYYNNEIIGIHGDIICFSFYATKTLATGEGGMLVTKNQEWADKARSLRLHGISKDAWNRYNKGGSWKYDVINVGYKYNTTDINSAIGLIQFDKLFSMNDKRLNIAKKYISFINDIKEIECLKIHENRKTSWHVFPIKLDVDSLKISRDEFISLLNDYGIGTSVHFIPLYRFTYYKDKYDLAEFNYPNSEWNYERIMSLPIYPSMTESQIEYICNTIKNLISKNKKN